MQMTAVVTPAAEGGFIAHNPETGTTTQGETIEETIANLRDATSLYLDESPPGVYRLRFGTVAQRAGLQPRYLVFAGRYPVTKLSR